MSPTLLVARRTAAARRLLARHRRLRWVPLIVCGVVFVLSVRGYESGADAERAAWGETRTVWVATADAAAGQPVRVTERELPVAVLPDRAAAGDDPIDGRIARQEIGPGEIVTTADLTATADAPLALLPDGWRAVPVVEAVRSNAAVGDQVEIVGDGIVIAPNALVVDATDETLLVAVPAGDAPLVALANDTGVTLLRTGRTGRTGRP